jgi:hypothetical protein
MPARLIEVYSPGDPVEIFFTEDSEWRPGRVWALQHPGVWVQTEDQNLWFVTNGRRIRARNEGGEGEMSS